MEFLKDILGDDLYKQVETKVSSYNSNNKDKEVSIANLGSGKYVSKAKYMALKTDLKKADQDNADLRATIAGYDTEVEMQIQLWQLILKTLSNKINKNK
ncbi:MAG: hypothetical protein FWF46_07550 [Oscillospiraceae bacterium]|nr:hypothetical protein [Oscillospiraceae bacterium]